MNKEITWHNDHWIQVKSSFGGIAIYKRHCFDFGARYTGLDKLGNEVSIKDLADLISKKTGFKVDIIWNKNFPNGTPRKKKILPN